VKGDTSAIRKKKPDVIKNAWQVHKASFCKASGKETEQEKKCAPVRATIGMGEKGGGGSGG